ncbi:MAG: hypothetical protein EPO26_06370 [Chloroflexota bacterium]|nr:MAG: hypothetical protein EPO26_06370 [Chloroflexota bacterium]
MISVDGVSVQDRDLLTRLTLYFQSLDTRLREGQGWFIFNADRSRASRIARFVLDRLAERRPFISYYHVPWRDFALNAYMSRVELPTAVALPRGPGTEYDLAGRISRDQFEQMRATDVLVLVGLRPEHRYEIEHLEAIMSVRFARGLASIVVTPHEPHQLMDAYTAQGAEATWRKLYDEVYRASLIAL